jgi:hypothetical protein
MIEVITTMVETELTFFEAEAYGIIRKNPMAATVSYL